MKKIFGVREVVLVSILVVGAFCVVYFLRGLKSNSEVQEVVHAAWELNEAYENFVNSHGEKPGDFWNAMNRFGICVTYNGNGNSVIDSNVEESDEPFLALQHLDLNGGFKGGKMNYNGSSDVSFRAQIHPTKFGKKDVGFYLSSDVDGKTILIYAKVHDENTNGLINANEAILPSISPANAKQLDEIYDDGNPSKGLVQTKNSSENSVCISSEGEYENSAEEGCYMIFSVKFKKSAL